MEAEFAPKANYAPRYSTIRYAERVVNLWQAPVDFISRSDASSSRSVYGAGSASPWRMTIKRHAGGLQPADAPWSQRCRNIAAPGTEDRSTFLPTTPTTLIAST